MGSPKTKLCFHEASNYAKGTYQLLLWFAVFFKKLVPLLLLDTPWNVSSKRCPLAFGFITICLYLFEVSLFFHVRLYAVFLYIIKLYFCLFCGKILFITLNHSDQFSRKLFLTECCSQNSDRAYLLSLFLMWTEWIKSLVSSLWIFNCMEFFFLK